MAALTCKSMKWFICFLMLGGLAACDNDDVEPTNKELQDIREMVQEDDWTLTYFFDTDKEETSNFTGYRFSFEPDGILRAGNGSNTYNGAWSIHDSDPEDTAGDYDDITFVIDFDEPDDFEELSEDWQVITLSNAKIELKHTSGGNGGTDLLTFERID